MKRKPLKRKPIRKISGKQGQRLIAYYRLRDQFLKENPHCSVCWDERGEDGWVYPARDVHHRSGRRGNRLLDVGTFLGVCRRHHDAIHRDMKWARQMGYCLPREQW